MADKGTSNELAPVTTADEAAIKNFDLDKFLVKLQLEEPFFCKILRKVTKVKTNAIPTAGVLASDGDIKMWWNPAFLASLTPKQVIGLLKHECYHLVFEHTTTRRHDPHVVWNYAADLAINSLIPEIELPKGGLIPGKAFDALTEEQLEKMDSNQINQFNAISAKIATFPKGEASEWYFARLMEDEAVKEAITNPAKGDGSSGMPGNMDDHEGWGDMSDEEREIARGKIRQAVDEAVKECDKKGHWGSIPAETRGKIREAISKEIPWEMILKQFVGMSRRAKRSTSRMRLNKKYPGIHSGHKRGYTSSIAVYIDQSGSVSNDELSLLFGELRNLAKSTEFVTYHFDTEVDEKSEAVWRNGKTPETHRTRCGGTCFKAPSIHANKNKHRFDGYLILTDGYAPNPGHSRLKRGWVVTTGGELQDFMEREVKIKMKERKAS
jgi:predicted metal-dependent peptidase